MAKKTKKQAFTIVELVIVIAVIAILAAIIIPTYSNLVKKANEATALVNAKNAITEMLANILGGDEEAADIIVMNKKGDEVYIHGYDASKGVILAYVANPEKLGSEEGFFNQAKVIRQKLVDNDYLEDKSGDVADDSWRNENVLNGENGTVVDLGFDRNEMVIFADCEITDKFAKKESGGEVPTCEHAWGDGEVTKAATCTETGVKTYTCSKCSETKTETIAALGHTWFEGWNPLEAKEPTCEAKGNVKCWYCAICKKGFTDSNGTNEIASKDVDIPALGHDYSVYENLGTKHKVKCSRCEKYTIEEHSFDSEGNCKCGQTKCVSHNYVDAYDETYHWKECSVCGAIDENNPKTAHRMSDWSVVKAQTCTTVGTKERHCEECAYSSIEEIPMHSYIYVKTGNPYKVAHSAKCEFCNVYKENEACNTDDNGNCSLCHGNKAPCNNTQTNPEEHFLCVYVKNIIKEQPSGHSVRCIACGTSGMTVEHDTYGENGACSVCGYKAHDHIVDDWTVDTAATCVKDGVKSGTCTVDGCNKKIIQSIPATGHNFNDYTKEDIFKHYGTCTKCNTEASASHEYAFYQTVETVEGKDYYKCGCGVLVSVDHDETLSDIINGGCNIDSSNWGVNTTTIDGVSYTVYAFTRNSGVANGKAGTYYVPVG